MNSQFISDSAAKGAAFLDQKVNPKSLNKVKKSSTSNTSSTSKDLGGINPALTLHQTSTKATPEIDPDSLVIITETPKGEERKSLLIDSKAAQVLKESLQGFLAHDIKSQTWHKFSGSHWEPLESPQLADNVLIELIYKGTGDLGFKSAYKNGIKSLLCDSAMLPLPEIDNSKLPFKNGLLDLSIKKLESITPGNAQTWCLPYDYKTGVDCPKIKAWLLQAVDQDKETVNFLRAWMAAVLRGRADLQKFLHLKGSSGTGKGTFMRLLTALIGQTNTVSTSLDQLEQNRFEAAALYNKRLAVISESDKYGGSINNLKAITGQDHIRLERKHQQQAGSFVFQGLDV